MSDRFGKSIFAHKQTYSRKGNSKSRSVREIADEAERLEGACPHVEDPQPPTILEGIRPSEVVALIDHGWSGSPSRSYKQAMRGWQDRYHAEVGAKHGQARTGPRRRRLDRAAWKAEQERLKAQKDAEIAVERAEEARRLADEEERRRDLVMQDTVASRLQEAETVHAIATGGVIAAIQQIDPDPVLLERLETPGQMGSWTNHDADRNREMHNALAPVLSDGLEALRQPRGGPGLLGGLSGFLRGVAGWVNRLADASPRWLKWPETVAYVAQRATQAFGTTYTASTLAGVIEASPAWQSFTGEARARLDQARAVQALTNPHDSRPDASSQRGI
ncbi:hypothetical protein [Paracoccus yeei]|uniref:hypothetical protein n=1 Tax=Paracoccus yeei TaxID=147645 RepID=UPI00048F5CB0|nr:hypothetical protein [Paracoccus yeei]OWJ89074.1 hypothetical protein CDV54_19585 [Paracoccus yeei]